MTDRKSSRRPWLLGAMALLVLGAAPYSWGYVANDLRLGGSLEAVGADLPPETSVLKSGVGVHAGGGRCVGVAARMLATERSPDEVAEFYANAELQLAWRERGRFLVRSTADRSSTAARAVELPAVIRKLLDGHAFLPKGVRRVVLYATTPLEARWDPRCP